MAHWIYKLGIAVLCSSMLNGCTNYADLIGNCQDGILDEGEETVDCGGVCPPCITHCDNGVMDGDEEGLDCGGSCSTVCPIVVPCEPVVERMRREIPSGGTITGNIYTTYDSGGQIQIEGTNVGTLTIRFYGNNINEAQGIVRSVNDIFDAGEPDKAEILFRYNVGFEQTNVRAVLDQPVYFMTDPVSGDMHIIGCDLEFTNGLLLTFNTVWE